MISYAAIAVIASLFYYIGEHEYHGKGWLLAIASVICSFVAAWVLPFAFVDILIGNVALYIGVFIYNLVSKRPPGGSSGF